MRESKKMLEIDEEERQLLKAKKSKPCENMKNTHFGFVFGFFFLQNIKSKF